MYVTNLDINKVEGTVVIFIYFVFVDRGLGVVQEAYLIVIPRYNLLETHIVSKYTPS